MFRNFSIGTYCIYSGEHSTSLCPESEGKSRFSPGLIIWDNQYWMNNSKKKGIVPRGIYVPGGSTGMHFCCQSNMDPNTPVSLPTDKPFYLLAYRSSVCQKVKWTTVIPEFIVYDTSDFHNHDIFTSFVPFNAKRTDPKIYYCYYQGNVNFFIRYIGICFIDSSESYMPLEKFLALFY